MCVACVQFYNMHSYLVISFCTGVVGWGSTDFSVAVGPSFDCMCCCPQPPSLSSLGQWVFILMSG